MRNVSATPGIASASNAKADNRAEAGEPDGPRQVQDPARGRTRAEVRRRTIFRALHRCIIEKGYSNTTLADVAQTAEMTPSHLLYYFPGKEGILEAYFDDVADWFLRRVADIASKAPEEQLHLLSQLWFGDGEAAHADIGFMLECFGEAVHDGAMRDTKMRFDRACKSHLEELFSEESLAPGLSSAEAAEVTYALLIGLRNSVYFDPSVSTSTAAQWFRNAVGNLKQR